MKMTNYSTIVCLISAFMFLSIVIVMPFAVISFLMKNKDDLGSKKNLREYSVLYSHIKYYKFSAQFYLVV